VVRIPPDGPKVPPHVPPVPPKKGGGDEGKTGKVARGPEGRPSIGRGPYEMDAHAIAIALAALAKDAKQKELSFEEIIQKVIEETGMTNPQAAMEEANKKLQKQIDETLDEIKQNKELMEEAEAWEAFARILEGELDQGQIQEFLGLLGKSVRGL